MNANLRAHRVVYIYLLRSPKVFTLRRLAIPQSYQTPDLSTLHPRLYPFYHEQPRSSIFPRPSQSPALDLQTVAASKLPKETILARNVSQALHETMGDLALTPSESTVFMDLCSQSIKSPREVSWILRTNFHREFYPPDVEYKLCFETANAPLVPRGWPESIVLNLINFYNHTKFTPRRFVKHMESWTVTENQVIAMIACLSREGRLKLLYGEDFGPNVKDPKTWWAPWQTDLVAWWYQDRTHPKIARLLSRRYFLYEFDEYDVTAEVDHLHFIGRMGR